MTCTHLVYVGPHHGFRECGAHATQLVHFRYSPPAWHCHEHVQEVIHARSASQHKSEEQR